MGKTRAVHPLVIGQFKSLECDSKKKLQILSICPEYIPLRTGVVQLRKTKCLTHVQGKGKIYGFVLS